MSNGFRIKNKLNVEPGATTVSDIKGDIKVTSAGLLNVHDGSSFNEVVDTDTSQTLSGKTLTSPIINGATLSVDDTDSAFNLGIASTSTLTGDKTLTFDVNDANRTVTVAANVTLDGLEVKGPASATDEAVVRFDGTTGKLTQNSVVTITDAGIASGVTQLNVDNLRLDGNSLSSTDVNGDLTLSPNGTGDVVINSDELDASISTTLSLGTSNSATTVNIGTGTHASNLINIGGAASTINFTGTVNNNNVTNLNVTDKLITINDGGGVGSGGSSGIEIEENAVATGYAATSSDRNSWELKAPNTAGVIVLTPGASGFTLDGSQVSGPGSATDEAIVRFDGTTGKLVQNSVITATDAGVVAGVTQLNVDNLRLDGNTLSSTDANGNVVLDPNGSGIIDAQAQVNVVGALRSDTSLILEETGAGTDTITIQAPSSIAASYSLTLPVDDGMANQILQTDGSGVLSWVTASAAGGTYDVSRLHNIGLMVSAAGGDLTIELKQSNGSSDFTGGSPGEVGFRTGNETAGAFAVQSIGGAISDLVIPSGATLGHETNSPSMEHYVYVYLMYNSGNPELAVSSAYLDEHYLRSSTAITTAADDSGFYSTTARTDQPIRLIARIQYNTAPNGTWVGPDIVTLINQSGFIPRSEYAAASSSVKTPANSSNYLQMTGNSIVLTPGEWDLKGHVLFNNAAATSYTATDSLWTAANGADSGVQPALLSSVVSIIAPTDASNIEYNFFALNGTTIGGTSAFWTRQANELRVLATKTVTIFLVPFVTAGTHGNARVSTHIYAKRVI